MFQISFGSVGFRRLRSCPECFETSVFSSCAECCMGRRSWLDIMVLLIKLSIRTRMNILMLQNWFCCCCSNYYYCCCSLPAAVSCSLIGSCLFEDNLTSDYTPSCCLIAMVTSQRQQSQLISSVTQTQLICSLLFTSSSSSSPCLLPSSLVSSLHFFPTS